MVSNLITARNFVFFAFLVLSFSFLPIGALADYGAELVPNPNFLIGRAGDATLPQGWTFCLTNPTPCSADEFAPTSTISGGFLNYVGEGAGMIQNNTPNFNLNDTKQYEFNIIYSNNATGDANPLQIFLYSDPSTVEFTCTGVVAGMSCQGAKFNNLITSNTSSNGLIRYFLKTNMTANTNVNGLVRLTAQNGADSAQIYQISIKEVTTNTTQPVGNGLNITDGFLLPSTVTYGTQQSVITSVIVQNGTTNGTVGAVYASVFGKNYTMTKTTAFSNSSGGGIFNLTFNWISNVTAGSQTIKFYANETIGGTNQTDVAQDKTLTISKGDPSSRLTALVNGASTNQSITLPSTANVSGSFDNLGGSDLVFNLTRINTTSKAVAGPNSPANHTTTAYLAGEYGFVFGTQGGANWTAGNSTPIGLTISNTPSPSNSEPDCGPASTIFSIILIVMGIGLILIVARSFFGGEKLSANLLVIAFVVLIIGVAILTTASSACG